LALVAGACSLARLRPSVREAGSGEAEAVPAATVR